MKTTIIFLSLILLYCFSFGQVDEKSSGKQTFSIGKKDTKEVKTDDKSGDEDSSGKELFMITKEDETGPEITILSPDNNIEVKEKLITITGQVKDESGILSVIVNKKEAIVSADGKFQADVFLAYGQNAIKIKALDVNQNISFSELIVNRKTGVVDETIVEHDADQTDIPELSADNNVVVTWKTPKVDNLNTSLGILSVEACIESPNSILEVQLYNNDKLLSNVEYGEVEFRGTCDFMVNKKIKLESGKNTLKIKVKTKAGIHENERMVSYDINNTRYYALIIGVEEYDDDRITDLSQPIADASELEKILTTHYLFDDENIIFLKNPSKSDIIGTLHQLRSKITENDNLLIFYAGHGYWDEEMGLGYWLPSDADQDNPVNWLPNTDLTNYLNAIKSKHTLLIADACFSGGIFKTRSAFNTTAAIEKLFQLKSRKAMTSGTLKEVPDKSVFIEFLLKRLKENEEKYITSEQLFSNMRMAIINNSTNVPQYGTIHNTGDEGGDFIFILK